MDVCEPEQALQKQSTAQPTKRQPLVPAENKNKNGPAFRAQAREVSSRHRSPTPSTAKRNPSPNTTPSSSVSSLLAPKRASSAEKKRPSRPSSPSTPIQDTSAEMISRKLVGNNKFPESLWPTTMRSLSVSFQSDTYSVPVSKREKPVSHTLPDRTLRLSPNVAHRQQAENLGSSKRTLERKRSPLKGKNFPDQSENSKPVDSLSHSRLVEQHRWPSRINGDLNRSIDLGDKNGTSPRLSRSGSGTSFLRRLSLESGATKPPHKSTSDLLMQLSRDDSGKSASSGCSVDESLLQAQKPGPSSSSDRMQLVKAAARALCSPSRGSRAPSPSMCRGVSPSRGKPVNNPSSRGSSPSRGRPSSPSRQPQGPLASVLSFIADIKSGKKAANYIEDVHQLRMLYNRHLQWRYANAHTCAALQYQKMKAENMLYSVWIITADLWDSIMEKRMELQELRLKLKLDSVLNNQVNSLDEWALIERDHVNSLTWAIQDLQASTIRIPVTGGARGDVETVKAAICAAVDVMQVMGSSLFSILSRVEGMNSLVSELANLVAHERAVLDECESVLGSTAAMQVEEYSLRTNLLQMKQAWKNGESSVYGY
ncbi:QWRF motif-containing protein 8 [Striga hermonthica]|uniref:QWRF motif-containing protein 8 n=1 Tax=Striga hermonthica TaxID=68872 RepID=A0A9N7NIV4_STRHE|nr:QWRF motif-containing protein 8 [Striga hermonthica]